MAEDAEAQFLRAMQDNPVSYEAETANNRQLTDEAETTGSDPASSLVDNQNGSSFVPAVSAAVNAGDAEQSSSSSSAAADPLNERVPAIVQPPPSENADAAQPGLLTVAATTNPTSQTPDSVVISPSAMGAEATDAPGESARGTPIETATAAAAPPLIPDDTVPTANGDGSSHSQPTQAEVIASLKPALRTSTGKTRLPQDRIGMLEDRIQADPRGDFDAWVSLLAEHRKRNKIDDARKTYDRFFKVFPTAAEQWVAYVTMELSNSDFYRAEQIFSKALLNVPNVELWSVYLDYVRRRNNLATDTTGNARSVVAQAYEYVLARVGQDKESGKIWLDYITFIKNGPGVVGGSSWQDQQKMDQLRKTYQKAICAPVIGVDQFWKEYDAFEIGLNKITGRKFLQEKSPAYMSARSSLVELTNLTQGLDRTTLPRLPPGPGYEGEAEYLHQVALWKRWIAWEIEDPLVLKEEDPASYKNRVVYTFKQALMALRFWPEMWFDAAEFCFSHDLEAEAVEFLEQGIVANPESCLLTFKLADHLESSTAGEGGNEGMKRRGDVVRAPYDKLLDALYEMLNTLKNREAKDISFLEEMHAQTAQTIPDENLAPEQVAMRQSMDSKAKAVKETYAMQAFQVSKTLSFVWIALMRAMRRIQGQGKVGAEVGGMRQVFADARKRGRLTSDVYITSALIEYHCYKDAAGPKIFERGMKLFPDDENFAMEYLKHLISVNDITNARAVFESSVTKLPAIKAKPLFALFHQYESAYGEAAQITRIEKRMRELYPEDPLLKIFAHRFSSPIFDPTLFRPIISPLAQTRPKGFALPIPPTSSSRQNSPAAGAAAAPTVNVTRNSPKRQLSVDEGDDANRPRKFVRSESPLKGAAGRKLDQQRRNMLSSQLSVVPETTSTSSSTAWSSSGNNSVLSSLPPPALPRDVLFLLSIIPKAHTYKATRLKPDAIVKLLQQTNIPSGTVALPTQNVTTRR